MLRTDDDGDGIDDLVVADDNYDTSSGASLDSAGDQDGDGLDDVVIGFQGYGNDRGAAAVVYGSSF